jgi:hypothetical protein
MAKNLKRAKRALEKEGRHVSARPTHTHTEERDRGAVACGSAWVTRGVPRATPGPFLGVWRSCGNGSIP